MKNIFFIVLWFSPVLNIALYWYRKYIDKQRKEGKYLKVGVQVHKTVISGPKNGVWFRYFFEDLLLKAVLASIPAIILKDLSLFLILLSIGVLALIFKIGITLYPFPFPVFFWNKRVWTFYCFTFYYLRGFGVFILGALAPAAILVGAWDLFATAPIMFSEPTVLAHFLDNSIGKIPIWVYYAVIIPFVAIMVGNIFYLWLKVTPLFTRFCVEYNNEVLRLISRITKREIAQIDFKKPYAYEQAFDKQRSFSTPGEMPAHIFAQDNKAISIAHSSSQSFMKETVRGHWLGLVSPVWDADLSGKVGVIYVVNPEECEEIFGKIIKKYWKKR